MKDGPLIGIDSYHLGLSIVPLLPGSVASDPWDVLHPAVPNDVNMFTAPCTTRKGQCPMVYRTHTP